MSSHLPVRFFLPAIVAALLFASCTKDGPTGPSGPAGKDGNANVLTRVITIPDSMYTLGNYYFTNVTGGWMSGNAKVATIVDSTITGGIVDSGMVLVYFRSYQLDSAWVPLPFKYLAFGGPYYYNVVFDYKEFTLRIYVYLDENYNGATVPSIYAVTLPSYMFKYLVISGTSLKRLNKEGVNLRNEQEVEWSLHPVQN